MKAMVLESYNADLRLSDLPEPVPGPEDIVVRVRACGMCQTDIKLVSGQLGRSIKLPHVPGHEVAGEVAALGKDVRGLALGDKGVAFHIVPCGVCELCLTGRENLCTSITRIGFELPGGFAEYVAMPAANFCTFESDMAFDRMAILPDAVATPYHALGRLARLGMGNTVLIIGLGGLGIHAVQLALGMGAMVIGADVNEKAIELAKSFGLGRTTNPLKEDSAAKLRDLTGGKGVDLIIDGVGRKESVDWSLSCLKKGGHYYSLGYDPVNAVCFNMLNVHNNEWSIHGVKATTRQELREVISIVERGLLRPYVSKTLPLEGANEGLAAIKKGQTLGRTVLVID
jgi:D-arabinose 1-dehydrogenase-like Zn-dependent alcohol dehydrogenase